MLWLLAFHIIAVVAWFSGLFYLPRLFVYHVKSGQGEVHSLFNVMQHKLYYYIMWPAAILTTVLGGLLLYMNWSYYLYAPWMYAKLVLVALLWVYHLSLGHMHKCFVKGQNQFSERFFRIYNEVPTLLLISIILLVVLKP